MAGRLATFPMPAAEDFVGVGLVSSLLRERRRGEESPGEVRRSLLVRLGDALVTLRRGVIGEIGEVNGFGSLAAFIGRY